MNCLASHAKVNMMKSAGFWFLSDQEHENAAQSDTLVPLETSIDSTTETSKEKRSRRHGRSRSRVREITAESNELAFQGQTKSSIRLNKIIRAAPRNESTSYS